MHGSESGKGAVFEAYHPKQPIIQLSCTNPQMHKIAISLAIYLFPFLTVGPGGAPAPTLFTSSRIVSLIPNFVWPSRLCLLYLSSQRA
jgi:hypothetical protein